jgi:signal transduction histidine kinase/CheY-like chemotaxis protein
MGWDIANKGLAGPVTRESSPRVRPVVEWRVRRWSPEHPVKKNMSLLEFLHRTKLRLTIGVLLIGGLTLTGLVSAVLGFTAVQRDRERFEADAQAVQDDITYRVETSIALLRGVAGLFASHGSEVTVASFRAYMARIALREQYSGILGIGYSRRVAVDERGAFEREMRAQGHPDFRIWPAHERAELHTIIYLEPLDERNRAAIGYDMFTNEVRRAAMERARDQGAASASGAVELVQEIHERKQPGFLIYLPVYRGGAIPGSVDERRAQLLGFAYAPIRAGDFLSSAFLPDAVPELSVAVYHGSGSQPQSLLYEHVAPAAPARPRFSSRSTIDVAGEPWTFVYRSRSTLAQSLAMPLLVAAGGGVLVLLLALLLWREQRSHATVEKALERERAARSQAERANVMKDQFLATLSHELRTPLNAIVGWAEVLRRGNLSREDVRSAIEVVDRNAKAQARLIDDLLDMNRIISGKLRISFQPVDPAAELRHALSTVAPMAQTKGVRLETQVAPSPLTVLGDAARLQQVIWNLLSNAIKFTPSGGEVKVSIERAGSRMRLTVADNGEGIEPEALERIFDRFAQVDGSITRRHGGLGLGLSIVRELVDLQGGTVRAHSAGMGRGASFVVELPLMSLRRREGEQREAPVKASLEGLKVLVVDDAPDARELVRLVLTQRHAEVRCAASGAEALKELADFLPDVVLSDIGMAGMDGYELMRRIRSLPAAKGGSVAAAALTAYAREHDRLDALRAGYQTHLVKPVRPEELVAVVAALGQRQLPSARSEGVETLEHEHHRV